MLPLSLSALLHPTLTQINRLPPRATYESFPHAEAAKSGNSTPHRLTLDGIWQFKLVAKPEAAPENWVTGEGWDKWRDIKVPGVWTRQDTGDFPHYTNVVMPFKTKLPPAVPDENPAGLYATHFKKPAAWQSGTTVLHIGGFESAALVWCNGRFVGMGKDSRLPSEFDLTPYLLEGDNKLAIMVIRFSDATWIEDQDHWNHGGIHRSVYLEQRAPVHVSDLKIVADFDPVQKTGALTVRAAIEGPSTGYKIGARLETAGGRVICDLPHAEVDQLKTDGTHLEQTIASHMFHGYAATTAADGLEIAPWSDEQPHLYRLITELISSEGTVLEAQTNWVGFRRIEVAGRRLKINGNPIMIIGVNRHDHHPENGKTVSKDEMRDELLTMKAHNINAIRTAHYPNDPALLDLADALGFYVIDEANVESHGRYHSVSNNPEYGAAIMERTVRMIERDKNHACIIGWSPGNESGHAPIHSALASYARHVDPTRFFQYEGAVTDRFMTLLGGNEDIAQQPPSAIETVMSDIVCPMYPPIDFIVNWAKWAEDTKLDQRPLIMCEYSHAMGNSNGSLSAYVDAFYAEPALSGGFIWDWRDQGLAETDAEGNFYWAYGGHYGDEPNDKNFNINGIVGPDGVPHPALREYQWAARPVKVERAADGRLTAINRRIFTDTSDLVLMWHVQKDGVTVQSGETEVIIKPGASERLNLAYDDVTDEDGEAHLLLEWRLKTQAAWGAAGHCVAWDQVALSSVNEEAYQFPTPALTDVAGPRRFQKGDIAVAIGADNQIEDVRISDKAVIRGDVSACVWRAPTDNDGGKPGVRESIFPTKCTDWVAYGLNALERGAARVTVSENSEQVQIGFHRKWTGANEKSLEHFTLWTLGEGGAVIDEKIIVPDAWRDVPRVGIRFETPEALTNLSWFGLGPNESYPDRRSAQTVGKWASTLAEQYHPYVRPQEYGAHEATRWFTLTGSNGGVRITLPAPMSFTARRHHDVDLNNAETLADLQTQSNSEVHIDAAVRGMGTGACGPDTLEQFRVGPGVHAFQWGLKGVRSD